MTAHSVSRVLYVLGVLLAVSAALGLITQLTGGNYPPVLGGAVIGCMAALAYQLVLDR